MGSTGRRLAFYFCGFDAAPAQSARADDGAIVITRAIPKGGIGVEVPLSDRPEDYDRAAVYARKVRNASARQWSGFIHLLDKRFGLSMIVADPGGGGLFIRKEMASSRQMIENAETEVTPIVTPDDPTAPVSAKYNLRLFKRGDPGVESIWPGLPGDDVLLDAAHCALREAIDHSQIALPVDAREWRREQISGWSEEKQWALRNLSEMCSQLANIKVATNDDGTFIFTKRQARVFSAQGKKDIAYSLLYAEVAFRIWLKQTDQEEYGESESDSGVFVW